MEYYCNRFKFGKPDLSYDEVTEGRSKRGAKISRWEAVMTVGGRKIGVASGSNKKLATKLCYLDVTQYLESCDHNLWSQFISQDGGKSKEDVRKAPHLLFNCSDNLVELVRELCSEARGSQLFKKAPTPNTVAEPMVIAHQPFTMPADGVLKGKSAKLQERLKIYEVDQDPSVSKMRELRASLPIYSYKEEILRTIDENEVTVLTANTGSGKSTQTPQYILDKYILAGKGADCRILVTQPRRLAALALADRVSDERNSKIGREVGYHVRFDAKLPEDNGNITFMTIGILLKRLQSALSHQDEVTWFDAVSHIVLDEVHERDLDTDLLLVILKRMLKTRKQAGLHTPKILLMSATINADLFREYFKNDRGIKAPLVDVPGKTFPVQRNYLDGFIGDLQRRAVGPASWVFQVRPGAPKKLKQADNGVC
jgi:small subunit ribosomal protein S24e